MKLCMMTVGGGRPRASARSSAAAHASWYGRKHASARAAASRFVRPRLPGTGVPSLTSGIDCSSSSVRLQSMTRRE